MRPWVLAYTEPRSTAQLFMQRSGTSYCSTSDCLRKKATTLPQKHSEKQSHQDSVVMYHQFRSVVVDSNPAVAHLLDSASEVKHERMLRSWSHLWTTLCVVGNKASLCEVTAIKKVDQATVSGLSSASDGPGIVLFDKEAGCPGNFIALLEFRTQLLIMAAAVLRDFHRNGQEGKQVNYLSPKIQNELTDCSTKLSSG